MSHDSRHDPNLNPYGPTRHVAVIGEAGPIALPPGTARGMVGQVQIIGVLMIVQGVLDTMMAIAFAIYAFAMPMVFEEMQREAAARGGQGQPMPANIGLGVMIGGSVMSLLILLIGVLTVYAGIRVIQFRGRVLAIAMLCNGMWMIFTCYCLPTSLALAIYGMVVLLNGPVKLAFDLRARGHDVPSIQRAFLSIV